MTSKRSPLPTCAKTNIRRIDTNWKGLVFFHYAKACDGTLQAFTGIGNDYQPPARAELSIDTSAKTVTDATDEIERMMAETGILFDELVDLAANI